VISPHDLYTEVEENVAEWLAHGTLLVFVVNPRRRTVAVHRPDRRSACSESTTSRMAKKWCPAGASPCTTCSASPKGRCLQQGQRTKLAARLRLEDDAPAAAQLRS
jgi:hypothetical protein